MIPFATPFSGQKPLDITQLFTVKTYTGSKSGRQTINCGFAPDLVIIKDRSSSFNNTCQWWSRARGDNLCFMDTSGTTGQTGGIAEGVTFTSNGFTVGGASGAAAPNILGTNYVAFCFKKAAGFLDIVNYTGDGTQPRTIAHSLGATPGFVLLQTTNTGVYWHKDIAPGAYSTFGGGSTAEGSAGFINNFGSGAPGATSFSVGSTTNISATAYTAVLFGHQNIGQGVVFCGSQAPDSGTGVMTVSSMPFQPGFVFTHPTNSIQNSVSGTFDIVRGWAAGVSKRVNINLNTGAESTGLSGAPASNGFTANIGDTTGNPQRYVAIRTGSYP